MSVEKEELVPVRSESELAVGMLVVLRSVADASKSWRFMLIANVATYVTPCPSCRGLCVSGWEIAPAPFSALPIACFKAAIPSGRLFRVITGAEGDDMTEVIRLDKTVARQRAADKARERTR